MTSDDPKQSVSATPLDVPEDPTYPPGVTENGIESVSTLLSAHKKALATQSVTVHEATTATRICHRVNSTDGESFSCEGETVIYDGTIDARVANQSHYLFSTRSKATRREHVDAYVLHHYANGERIYTNQTRAENTTYQVQRNPNGDPIDPRNMLYLIGNEGILTNYLHSMNIVSVEQIQDSPTQLYRITADGFEKPEEFIGSGDQTVSDGHLTLVVAENGAIQSYNSSYTTTDEQGRVHVEQSVSYENWGNTTVDASDWISKVNETNEPTAETATATEAT
ncbi:hypothetical protein [Haladaptatus sp. ZSTT2]|uniref:hypothetical protein n=1 Tax=Haladaptatus sp. ZSTT2 TaxID=3120515 RepID=UPI00300F3996